MLLFANVELPSYSFIHTYVLMYRNSILVEIRTYIYNGCSIFRRENETSHFDSVYYKMSRTLLIIILLFSYAVAVKSEKRGSGHRGYLLNLDMWGVADTNHYRRPDNVVASEEPSYYIARGRRVIIGGLVCV